MSDEIGTSPAGVLERIPNLKKRQRSIYYRPIKKRDGSVEWTATRLLPSDALGRELYLSKGFKLSLPKPGEPPNESPNPLLDENKLLRQQLKDVKALKGIRE